MKPETPKRDDTPGRSNAELATALAEAIAAVGVALGGIAEKMLDKAHFDQGQPKMMDARQIAEFTGLSREKIYRDLEAGKLKGIRVGRRVVFKPEDVEEWLRNGDVR